MVKLSVVIPAYNEAKHIGSCLSSLAAQQTTVKFEVVVVDNASTDDTVRVAQTYRDVLSLRIISEPYKSRGAARATGFSTARGDVICSTDADTKIPQIWIQTIAEKFSDPQLGVISGTCFVKDSTFLVNFGFSTLQPLLMHLYRIFFRQYWLTGSNFAIRKSVYTQSGGFTRTLGEQEDVELAFRVNKISPIKFFAKPGVEVSGRRFRGGLIHGLQQYMQSFVGTFVLKQQTVRLHDER